MRPSRWHETYDNKVSISHKRHSVSRLEIDTIRTRKIHYQPLSRNKAFKRRPSRGLERSLWSTDLFTASLTYQLMQLFGCIHSELIIMDGYVSKILLNMSYVYWPAITCSLQWSTCHENWILDLASGFTNICWQQVWQDIHITPWWTSVQCPPPLSGIRGQCCVLEILCRGYGTVFSHEIYSIRISHKLKPHWGPPQSSSSGQ